MKERAKPWVMMQRHPRRSRHDTADAPDIAAPLPYHRTGGPY